MTNHISEQESMARAEYVRITEAYGRPLKASTFAHVVRKAGGSADGNALIVLVYILDFCRPLDGRSRWGGRDRITFNSEWLAENEFFITTRMLKSIREKLSRLGLVKFHTSQHSCWVEPVWAGIDAAVRCHPLVIADGWKTATLGPQQNPDGRNFDTLADPDRQKTDALESQDDSDSRRTDRLKDWATPDGRKNDTLKSSDGQKTDCLAAQTDRILTPLPILETPISPPSFAGAPDGAQEEEEEEEEASIERRFTTPRRGWAGYRVEPKPVGDVADLTAGLGEAETVTIRCVERGRRQGRSCDGPWLNEAIEAVRAELGSGTPIEVIEDAYAAYLDHHVARDGSAQKATDLGHWIRGQGCNGLPRDEGEWAWASMRDAAVARARRDANRVTAETGAGIPEHRFTRVQDGGGTGIVVSLPGTDKIWYYDAVPPTASSAECEDAFPGWWARMVADGLHNL